MIYDHQYYYYYIESNWFGMIKYIDKYINSRPYMIDKIYIGRDFYGYIKSNSEEIAIKKFRELLLKKIGH